jgi:hemoglobin
MQVRAARVWHVGVLASLLVGCGGGQTKDPKFFTSGSRPADQRAEQRLASHGQLSGEANANQRKSLYERVGADAGLNAIAEDWLSRAMADPRVNWNRASVMTGGFMGIDAKSVTWNPTAAQRQQLKTHIVQFLSLATGGPTTYTGKDMTDAHHGMKISNAEFDAAIGDMNATLDKLQVGVDEQKELLSILESTRPQVVEVR